MDSQLLIEMLASCYKNTLVGAGETAQYTRIQPQSQEPTGAARCGSSSLESQCGRSRDEGIPQGLLTSQASLIRERHTSGRAHVKTN